MTKVSQFFFMSYNKSVRSPKKYSAASSTVLKISSRLQYKSIRHNRKLFSIIKLQSIFIFFYISFCYFLYGVIDDNNAWQVVAKANDSNNNKQITKMLMQSPVPCPLSLSCSCSVGCLLLPIFWQWCARANLFACIPAHKYIERNLCLHLFKVLLILLSFSDILVVVVVVLAEGRLHLSHVVFPLSVCVWVCVHMWDYLHMGLSVCGLPSLRMQKSASEINTKKKEGKQQHNIKLAKKSKTKRRTGNASGSSRQHESCTETRPTSQGSSPGVCFCCCCYCCCVSVTQISCGVLRACLPLAIFLSLSLSLAL